MRRIAVITTGRADYGLLYPLIREMMRAGCFDLQLIVTGSHLSPLHGRTIEQIKQDGLPVSGLVIMTAESDTETATCDSIATGLKKFSRLFKITRPDLVIVLGDRYELWAVCQAAVIHRIPIAHLYGGETTIGAIDESVRHSVTKMSALHFAAMNAYAKRIIQMGENPGRVHVVGALGLDNIRHTRLMNIREISAGTGINFAGKNVALLTYHPVTLDDYALAGRQIRMILDSVLQSELTTIITRPNADTGGNAIYQVISSYTRKYPGKFSLIKNLGRNRYLSAMKHARLMIGNSSSGIIESASFKLPVINIGDRQGGRFKPANVIDCECSTKAVSKAIDTALSAKFRKSIARLRNPYGDGNAAKKIVNILNKTDLSNKSALLKKCFFDF